MIGAIGLLSVLIGAVAAYGAKRFPAHVEMLDAGAGVLLIGGFALTGCALPILL